MRSTIFVLYGYSEVRLGERPCSLKAALLRAKKKGRDLDSVFPPGPELCVYPDRTPKAEVSASAAQALAGGMRTCWRGPAEWSPLLLLPRPPWTPATGEEGAACPGWGFSFFFISLFNASVLVLSAEFSSCLYYSCYKTGSESVLVLIFAFCILNIHSGSCFYWLFYWAPLACAPASAPQGRGTADNPSETPGYPLRLAMMDSLCPMLVMASGNSGRFWVLEMLKDVCGSLWVLH